MLKIAVVAGGYTDEAVISLRSAELVYANLATDKYQAIHVRILKEGWYAELSGEKYTISKEDFSFVKEGEKIKFDAVFNTIHGTPGEDGYLQAYFQLIGLPFTGCEYYQSAITFNKKDCIAVLSKYDVPHAKSVYINKDMAFDKEEIISKVGLPCFVKPNKSGSSLGITKVKAASDFEKALEYAFKEDKEVLVESFLDGTEVSVGVLNYQGEIKVLGITEIVSENEFFDYQAKYEGKSKEITPARLTEEITQKVEEIAKKVYLSLGMNGFSRSDYIIVNGTPHFIEMNTLPGLSPASIFPQQAAYSKIELKDLFNNEITNALKRKSPWNV